MTVLIELFQNCSAPPVVDTRALPGTHLSLSVNPLIAGAFSRTRKIADEGYGACAVRCCDKPLDMRFVCLGTIEAVQRAKAA